MQGVQRWWLAALLAAGAAGMVACSTGDSSGGTDDPQVEAGECGAPGRVTLHRLNRTEYNNTVRDLLGVQLRPADDFPQDDLGGGYDNIAEVLTIAPMLVEKYDEAAANLAAAALEPGSAARSRLITCDPRSMGDRECARQVLERFLPRAWRRPVTDAEIERVLGLFDLPLQEGEGFDEGMKLALHAILVSPEFIFRVEKDPEPGQKFRKLDGYEIASRLSYFLWSTMPDDELFHAAATGRLDTPEGLEAEVDRMLRHEKAKALVENFAGQWLTVRAIERATPDPTVAPEWDEELREAMKRETQLVFEEILRENRNLLDLLDADFTYLNERLARHYDVDGVVGPEFQRLPSPEGRAGILTHAGFLTFTSNPTRTSPVKRGLWVLSQLLCEEPPAPPPGVEGLPEDGEPTGTLREQMERHRTDPTCASCHDTMDTIGFGLEEFSPIGKFRTVDDAGFAIDSSGQLPDGSIFDGAVELARILRNHPNVSTCMTEHALTYALGRTLTRSDECSVERIKEKFEAGGSTFAALARAIATSEPFRLRAAEKEERK